MLKGRNVAVVGVGYWGKNLVRNFHELGSLGALCDAREPIQSTYTKGLPDIQFYRDYSAVLADSSIDAVAIATPAVVHHEMAKAALLALSRMIVSVTSAGIPKSSMALTNAASL